MYTESKGKHNTRGRDTQEECRRKLILGGVCTSVWALQIESASVDGGRALWRRSLQVSGEWSCHCVCTSSHDSVSPCVCVHVTVRMSVVGAHTEQSHGAASRKPEWRQTRLSKRELKRDGMGGCRLRLCSPIGHGPTDLTRQGIVASIMHNPCGQHGRRGEALGEGRQTGTAVGPRGRQSPAPSESHSAARLEKQASKGAGMAPCTGKQMQ